MDLSDQASLQTMQQQLAAQAAELQHLRAAAPLAGIVAPLPSSIRIPAPPAFEGRHGTALAWLDRVEVFFDAHNLPQDDARRVVIFPTLLGALPTRWWMDQRTRWIAEHASVTWAEVRVAFLNYYQPLAAGLSARTELDALTQTRGVQQYCDQFRTLLLYVPDMHKNDQIHRFYQGLRPEIKQAIADKISGARDVMDLMQVAQSAEASRYHAVGARASRPLRPFFSSASRGYAYGSAPMELSHVDGAYDEREEQRTMMTRDTETRLLTVDQHDVYLNALYGARRPPPRVAPRGRSAPMRGPARPRLDEAARQRCFDQDLCFKCRKPGHRFRECPERNGAVASKQKNE